MKTRIYIFLFLNMFHVHALADLRVTTRGFLRDLEKDSTYVSPKRAEKKILSDIREHKRRLAVVTGYRGSGKSNLALHCMLNFNKTHVPKVVTTISDLHRFVRNDRDMKKKYCLVLKDVIGAGAKQNEYDKFEKEFELLDKRMNRENCILLTASDKVCDRIIEILERSDMFYSDSVLSLSDTRYRHEKKERMNIVSNYAKKYGVEISHGDIMTIAEHDLLDFPMSCEKFFKEKELANYKNDFMICQESCFSVFIEKMEKLRDKHPKKYFALVALAFSWKGKCCVLDENCEDDNLVNLIQKLHKDLNAGITSPKDLICYIKVQKYTYIRVGGCTQQHSSFYRFKNAIFENGVLFSFGKCFLETFIELAPLHILQRCSFSKGSYQTIHIPDTLQPKFIATLKQKGAEPDVVQQFENNSKTEAR